LGGTYTATALHNNKANETMIFIGPFTNNPILVVTFLNDAYAGTP